MFEPESTTLGLDLPVQLVISHKVDVLDPGGQDHQHREGHQNLLQQNIRPVLRCHWDGITLRLQQLDPGLTKLLHHNSEVNAHIILW